MLLITYIEVIKFSTQFLVNKSKKYFNAQRKINLLNKNIYLILVKISFEYKNAGNRYKTGGIVFVGN